MILKLALLASYMAEILIENLWKNLECNVIFAKQRPQSLHVACLTCVKCSILPL